MRQLAERYEYTIGPAFSGAAPIKIVAQSELQAIDIANEKHSDLLAIVFTSGQRDPWKISRILQLDHYGLCG